MSGLLNENRPKRKENGEKVNKKRAICKVS